MEEVKKILEIQKKICPEIHENGQNNTKLPLKFKNVKIHTKIKLKGKKLNNIFII